MQAPRTRVPVVLLHGARTSRTMWRAQVEALERTGRRALAVDLAGHGVHRGEPFSVERSLELVDEGVDEVGGRAVVVGLSLGGYLGIAYTARHPERVAGLVAAGCSTSPRRAVVGAWRLLARAIARLPDRGAWLNQTAVDRALPPAGARDVAAGGFALDVMVEMLTAMRDVRPLEDLARIGCPVWLVNGAWDHFRTQERAYLRACPTARLVHVPRATHLVNLVRPVEFTRVLLEAIDEVDEVDADEAARRDAARPVSPARRGAAHPRSAASTPAPRR